MNKTIWLEEYSDLPCPSCSNGFIYSVDQELKHESLSSLVRNEYHRKGQVAPDEDFLVTEHLQCSKCKDWVSVTYKLSFDIRHHDEEGNELPEIERVCYYPAPPIIDIPQSCPPPVAKLIKRSFSLFWVDVDSCGNKLRVAIEALMDEHNILPGGNATLHQKLKAYNSINAQVANYLLAIKWIGNPGSHTAKLNKRDLIDAYELTEYSLHQLYNDREIAMNQISQEINQRKGPRN